MHQKKQGFISSEPKGSKVQVPRFRLFDCVRHHIWGRNTYCISLEVLGHHFLFGFGTTSILVGIYHHPQGTCIFEMVATTSRVCFYCFDVNRPQCTSMVALGEALHQFGFNHFLVWYRQTNKGKLSWFKLVNDFSISFLATKTLDFFGRCGSWCCHDCCFGAGFPCFPCFRGRGYKLLLAGAKFVSVYLKIRKPEISCCFPTKNRYVFHLKAGVT